MVNPKKYTKEKSIPSKKKVAKPAPNFKIGAEPGAAFNWFPGHMLKAMREIKNRAAMVDLVIEIRDARVPVVSGNKSLNSSLNNKSRLILLNKVNLADTTAIAKWEEYFEKEGTPFMFINILEKATMKTVMAKARKIIQDKRTASNEGIEAKTKFKFMVIGLPNTGKSTFINQLANRNATKTADKPGQTRVQLWVTVDEDLQLLDTPGVMPPQIESDEHKIWLSTINAIPDEIIGEEDPACYLVKYFMKRKSQQFLDRYKLESFDLGLEEVLLKIATVRGCLKPKGVIDVDRVYKLILMDFRQGELGKAMFGNPPKSV